MLAQYLCLALVLLVVGVWLFWPTWPQVRGVEVYGSMDCGWTRRQIEQLNKSGVPHVFRDCGKMRCPTWVKGFPTTRLPDGKIIVGYKKIL